LFSSWVHRSVVLLKRRFGRQTSSRWRFSRKNDWVVQVIPQHAIKAMRVPYSKNSDRAAEVGVVLFTTALGLYGGVLWSGELQGPIIHEAVPTRSPCRRRTRPQAPPPAAGLVGPTRGRDAVAGRDARLCPSEPAAAMARAPTPTLSRSRCHCHRAITSLTQSPLRHCVEPLLFGFHLFEGGGGRTLEVACV
jgi:hypothetical protein